MGRKLKWSENTYFQIMHYSIQMFPTISLHFFNMNSPRNSKTYRECCDGCWTCREDNKHSSKLWQTLIDRCSFWYIQNKKKYNVSYKKPGSWFLLVKCGKNTCGSVKGVVHLFIVLFLLHFRDIYLNSTKIVERKCI